MLLGSRTARVQDVETTQCKDTCLQIFMSFHTVLTCKHKYGIWKLLRSLRIKTWKQDELEDLWWLIALHLYSDPGHFFAAAKQLSQSITVQEAESFHAMVEVRAVDVAEFRATEELHREADHGMLSMAAQYSR